MSVTSNLAIAPICEYLSVLDSLQSNTLFNNSAVDERTSKLIYIVNRAVNNINTLNPAYDGLDFINNYFYSVLSQYVPKANGIYGINGGSLAGTGGSNFNLIPYATTFTVTSLEAGVQAISNGNWVGLQYVNEVVINQQVFQVGAEFVFYSVTGTLNFALSNYTLQTGDIISFSGYRQVTSTQTQAISIQIIWISATAGTVVTDSRLVGHTITLLLRGGTGSGEIIIGRIPTGSEVLFDNMAGTLTVASGNDWVDGELLTVQMV